MHTEDSNTVLGRAGTFLASLSLAVILLGFIFWIGAGLSFPGGSLATTTGLGMLAIVGPTMVGLTLLVLFVDWVMRRMTRKRTPQNSN